jgi:hypothetical protein
MSTAPLTIITGDIETSPIIAKVWGLFKQNVGLNQIEQDWSIMSIAFKYLGASKVYYNDVSGQDDLRDDSAMVMLLWQMCDEADVLIGQNFRRFDAKKMAARWIEYGLPPPSPYIIIDTLEMAKASAAFTSNKQDWLSQKLTALAKEHHDEFPGMELWNECLKGNPRAWQVMKKYNIRDVAGCEEMYLALRPHYPFHPNLAAYTDSEEMQCTRCLSTDLTHSGSKFTNVSEYKQYRCGNCGGFCRDRYTINSKAKRRALLMSQ